MDIARDLALKDACKTEGDACNVARRDFNAAINTYTGASALTNPRLSGAGNAAVTNELNQSLAIGNDPKLAAQTRIDAFLEFAVPQVTGYAIGGALGAYLAEARAIYAGIKAQGSTVVGVNSTAAIPSGFRPFNVEGLPAGSTGVVNAATGEIKVLTPTGQLTAIPPTPIPSNINASVVPQSSTGIKWGGGISEQGLPFETYLAETTMPAGSRLPTNFKTFDFFDLETGIATSAKTLDTMTAAKVSDPAQVFTSLKGNVDAVAGFSGSPALSGVTVNSAKITARELQVAIPAGTTPAQWAQINKAIDYAQGHGVALKITVVK